MSQSEPGLKAHLRNTFLAGILAAMPLAITAFILWYVEVRTRALFGVRIPFLGVAIAIAGVYLLGLIVRSLLGRALLQVLDALLARVPWFKDLYHAWKHIALTPEGQGMFSRVVLVPDVAGRARQMGFTNARPVEGDLCCVFLPAAPNPTSGRLVLVNLADCQLLDIPAEEAFKMILSGGNYVPRLGPAAPE